jgi:hypothetical protein
MLVIAVLTATMMMGINNLYGKVFADPVHCDQPGWPSCYKVGYDNGLGRSGSCPSGHSAAFCAGWYVATHRQAVGAYSSGSPPAQQQQQVPPAQQNNSTSSSGEGGSQAIPATTGGTQWKEYALVFPPLVNMHFHVYHNEYGLFIPWKTLCTKTQQYLVKPCDSLINPDGSLTSDGGRAVGCIWNGAVAAAVANHFNIPLDTIRSLLGGLASLTGCSGIVNLDQIQTSPDLQRALQLAETMAR